MRYVTIAPGVVQIEDGPVSALSPQGALLRVVASGVCRTDLELFHGCPLPNGCDYPVRPGHETAGIIEELGSEVSPELRLEVGQLVVVHPILNCGTCDACLSGRDSLCREGRVAGMEEPGGMAQFMTWPADRLVRVDGVDPIVAAILADAVATSYHALCRAELPKGGRLCVLGAGGLGTHVLELARALDPTVTLAAVVRSQGSAQRLVESGVPAYRGLEESIPTLRTDYGEVGRCAASRGQTPEERRSIHPRLGCGWPPRPRSLDAGAHSRTRHSRNGKLNPLGPSSGCPNDIRRDPRPRQVRNAPHASRRSQLSPGHARTSSTGHGANRS